VAARRCSPPASRPSGPWSRRHHGCIPPNPAGPAGRRILVVHGPADRVASRQRSFALAWTLAGTADVGYIQIDGAKHAMLRHHPQFDSFAASFTAAVLCPDTKNLPIPEPVRKVLDGGGFLTV
jgi:hypothetical protein